MSHDPVKAILDRLRTWPRQRQEDAAELLTLIEQHDRSPFRLSEEQAQEVRDRLADRDAPTLTLSELDQRLRRLGV